MMWTIEERRQRRSSEPNTALRYQLEHVRAHGRFEALVLADDAGLVLARAGERGICDELGAIAPLMSRSPLGMRLPPLLRGGEVAVRPIELNGQDLYIACIGGNVARDAHLNASERGVQRILASN
ncbi:MAG: hypothetical protein AAGE52_21375 [Myxococcota bacterium]